VWFSHATNNQEALRRRPPLAITNSSDFLMLLWDFRVNLFTSLNSFGGNCSTDLGSVEFLEVYPSRDSLFIALTRNHFRNADGHRGLFQTSLSRPYGYFRCEPAAHDRIVSAFK